MSEELKPCPFCGGEATRNDDNTVQCCNAECFEPIVLTNDGSPHGFWNTRPIEDALRASNAKLVELVERGVALCVRARVLEERWEEGARFGVSSSKTAVAAQEVLYDDMLKAWEGDARAAIQQAQESE